MPKCKITVVKRTEYRDLADQFLNKSRLDNFGACTLFQDGQEFVIEDFPSKPENFCDWAWADIHRDVVTVMFGGHFPWMEEPGNAITCCTDGFRPVVFHVEKIE